MKVTLEFDGQDERTEALQAQHAVDYMRLCRKLLQSYRSMMYSGD